MRTAIVETGCSRQTLLWLEGGGLFHKFIPKNNPEQKPLLGEFKLRDMLAESENGSEDDIDRIQRIDESHAVIKLLGYKFDPVTGNLKVHYDFLPGCSSIERAYDTNRDKYKFVLRVLTIDYAGHKLYKVVTVDVEEGY